MTAKVLKHPSARYDAGSPSPYHPNPPASYSPDYDYAVGHRNLRDWARHLADNSSIVTAVLSSRVANGIGPGLSYEPMTRDRKGNLLPELNDAIRRIHENWSRSADVSGELSRQEIERLAWRTWDLDGEVFMRRVNLRMTRDAKELPYHLQPLRTDWIPSNLTSEFKGRRIVHGIEKNEWGRPMTYFVEPEIVDAFSTSVGASLDPSKMLALPADQVWHLKRAQRINQTRGITILHAIIFRIADVAEFQQSHRLAARASADLFASINRSGDFDTTISSDEQETGADGETKRQWNFEHLQMIDGLQAGESVNFHTPAHPNQAAVDFVREELRAIASSCDVGVSQIGQFYESSFSAQRMEWVSTWRKTERDRSKFIGDFARSALYEQVVEVARLAGRLPARALRRADPETIFDVRIDGPTMPVIDPVKDRAGFEKDQENGWDSRHGIIRRMGRQPRDVDAERAQDDFEAGDKQTQAPAPTQTTDDGPDEGTDQNADTTE